MSTEPDAAAPPRRLAVVVARHTAAAGAPPGIDPEAFAATCLADTYEVLADLAGVTSGIVGNGPEVDELLWPGALRFPASFDLRGLAAHLEGRFDELIAVPADVPDLPGLVIAKVLKALSRADICLAPERGNGGGCVVIGVRVPWPEWVTEDIDLDTDPVNQLSTHAPRRSRLAIGPDWHRMRTAAAIRRLDPGL